MELTLVALLSWVAPAQTDPQNPSLEERRLAIVPEGYEMDRVVFSPDGRRVAFSVYREWGAFRLIVDSEEIGTFRENLSPVFSPNGKRWACSVRDSSDKEFVIVDEVRGPPFDCAVWQPVFSPDGESVAYGTHDTGGAFVMVNGTKGPYFDWVGEPVFSPDGGTVAYPARKDGRAFLYAGKEPSRSYERVAAPRFSPDGKLIAYLAATKDGVFAVLGESEGERFERVASPVFSPSGSTLAYFASRNGNDDLVVLAGKVVAEPDCVNLHFLTVSPNGRDVAFVVEEARSSFLVVGSRKHRTYPKVGDPVFSPDGTCVAYRAIVEGMKACVVIGEQESEPFDEVGPPRWNAKGDRVAFGCRIGNELWWKTLKVTR